MYQLKAHVSIYYNYIQADFFRQCSMRKRWFENSIFKCESSKIFNSTIASLSPKSSIHSGICRMKGSRWYSRGLTKCHKILFCNGCCISFCGYCWDIQKLLHVWGFKYLFGKGMHLVVSLWIYLAVELVLRIYRTNKTFWGT